jgi:hypothetical protein
MEYTGRAVICKKEIAVDVACRRCLDFSWPGSAISALSMERAAIDCDEWAETIERMIESGYFSWRPIAMLKARAEVFAYKNAAASIRALEQSEQC